MFKNRTILVALAVASLASLAAACGDSGTPTTGGPAPAPKPAAAKTRPPLPDKYKGMTNAFAGKADAIEAGKAVYNGKGGCATCHGPLGDGNTPTGKSLVPPAGNLMDQGLHGLGDTYVFYRITEGSAGTGMTPYEKQLSADERWQLATYIMSLK